ncbi:unnamed protein product [Pleuronectes platessa]|uniref:Uncharacterized protein n=1 Tax=Pleuronectes platessa TaxID=8262 RepID=A0A9N7UYD6_PLEPL|nr:unnamed protein product [Pleuronectes platessa]
MQYGLVKCTFDLGADLDQLEAAGDSSSLGSDAITDTNRSEVSRWFPSAGRACACGPSTGEGARPPFRDGFTEPRDILAPDTRTLGFLKRQERPKYLWKRQNVLEYIRAGGSSCGGGEEEEVEAGGHDAAVSSVQQQRSPPSTEPGRRVSLRRCETPQSCQADICRESTSDTRLSGVGFKIRCRNLLSTASTLTLNPTSVYNVYIFLISGFLNLL